MSYTKEFLQLEDKLTTLKKVIGRINNYSIELIHLSAMIEMKMKKEEMTIKETKEFENKIDIAIKEASKINFKNISLINLKGELT